MSQNKIYVGSLSYSVLSNELEDFFSQYGELSEVKLISDRETGQSKGFAFITFASQQSAESALSADGTELKGRKIRVNMAKDDVRRSGGGGHGHGGGRHREQSRYAGSRDDR